MKNLKSKIIPLLIVILIILKVTPILIEFFKEMKGPDTSHIPTIENMDDETLKKLDVKMIHSDTIINIDKNLNFRVPEKYYSIKKLQNDTLIFIGQKKYNTISIYKLKADTIDISKAWKNYRLKNTLGRNFNSVSYGKSKLKNQTINTHEYFYKNLNLTIVGIAKLFEIHNNFYFVQMETNYMKDKFQTNASQFLEKNIILK